MCSQFLSAFLKFAFNFQYFEKTVSLIVYVYRRGKTCLCLKSNVSVQPRSVNFLNGSKHS